MQDEVVNVPSEPDRKKLRGWRLAGVIVGSIVFVLAVAYVWLSVLGSSRWDELEKVCKGRLAETRARDSSRPVLRGTATPGNGWTDYAVAIKELDQIHSSERFIPGQYLERRPEADRSKVEALLFAHPAVVERVRQGVMRESGQYPHAWEDGYAARIPGLVSCQMAAALVLCDARFHTEAGKVREAAEIVLDVCQYARDMAHNGSLLLEMISIALYNQALDELRDLVLSGKLTPEDLREIDRELELLDRSFPSNALVLRNEALGLGWSMVKEQTSETGGAARSLSVFGGPGRLMMADAFIDYERAMKSLADLESKPWPEVQRGESEIAAEFGKSWNPIKKALLSGPVTGYRVIRERRAQLRLLRIAVRYRATGEVSVLDDPFGATLRTARTGDRLKIWSLGREGLDHGGAGAWKPAEGKDIVLEVDR